MQNISRKTFYFRFAFWLWCANILILSILPSRGAITLELKPESLFRADYMIHFFIFLLLGILYFFAYIKPSTIYLKHLLIYLAIGIAVAFFSEFAQKFNPNRTFNPVDFYYNVAGVLFGFIGFILFRNKFLADIRR